MSRTFAVLSTLVLLVAAGLGTWLAFQGMPQSPEEVVCTRLMEVCGAEEDAYADCTEATGEWMRGHPEQTADLAACVTDAETCGGVSGCLAGAGLRSLGADVGEFFEGLGRALGLGR